MYQQEIATALQKVDWQRPWLAPLRDRALEIAAAPNWLNALNDAAAVIDLHNYRGKQIHFVPQKDLPAGTAYEAHIGATGAVPTRANLHDFFNAIIWLTYPRIKVQLNYLQAMEIAQRALDSEKPVSRRGSLRDGATIFDENAAIFVTVSPELVTALQAHEWRQLFVDQRERFQSCADVYLFGHALIEKLVAPYKAITAHTWTLIIAPDFFLKPQELRISQIDQMISQQIAKGLRTSDYCHLPILGIPDWWEGQSLEFYRDVQVFRPKRLSAKK